MALSHCMLRFAGMANCVPHRILDNIRDCPPSQRSERDSLGANGSQTRRIAQVANFTTLLVATEKLLRRVGISA